MASNNYIDDQLRRAKIAYLEANPGVSDVDVVLDHFEFDQGSIHIYARIVPKVKSSNYSLKVTIDNDKVDSEIG